MHGAETIAGRDELIFVMAQPVRKACVVNENLAEDRSWRRRQRIRENAFSV
jgi:hypothetical protein